MTGLTFQNLRKSFGGHEALKGLNLDIQAGEFFSLLGPSGCGKTTALRIIAGFEQPTSGAVLWKGEDLASIPPHRRPVNTVFQNYALFPHLSVFGNIAFGLRIRKVAKPEIELRVTEILELVNLPGYGRRTIDSLSGGEKQRVALARALVNKPDILLLDEPLGALDLQLRRKVQFEIKEIHRRIGNTFIYVTHDQEEALAMSDRIAVMVAGEIEQSGTPQEIYDRPDSRFVAKFIGSSNLLDGVVAVRADGAPFADIDVQGFGQFQAPIRNGAGPGTPVGILIRPEKVQIVQDNARAQGIQATVEETLYLGSLIQYQLRISPEHRILAVAHLTAQKNALLPGQKVRIRWAPEDLVVVER